MHNVFPTLFTILAIAVPLFEVVFSASGKCAPTKMIQLNSCLSTQGFSLDPQMDCTGRYTPELCGNKGCASDVPQNDPTDPDPRALKGYDINDLQTGGSSDGPQNDKLNNCLCKGYQLLIQCISNICPVDSSNIGVVNEAKNKACSASNSDGSSPLDSLKQVDGTLKNASNPTESEMTGRSGADTLYSVFYTGLAAILAFVF